MSALLKIPMEMNCKCCGNLFRRGAGKLNRKYCSFLCFKNSPKTADFISKISGKNHRNWIEDRNEATARKKSGIRFRNLIGRLVHGKGFKKKTKTSILLGYSIQDFRKHIEIQWSNGMNWNNHGNGEGKWNVDHIRPINTFAENSPANIVNALSNLRPLWYNENIHRPHSGNDTKKKANVEKLYFMDAKNFVDKIEGA